MVIFLEGDSNSSNSRCDMALILSSSNMYQIGSPPHPPLSEDDELELEEPDEDVTIVFFFIVWIKKKRSLLKVQS